MRAAPALRSTTHQGALHELMPTIADKPPRFDRFFEVSRDLLCILDQEGRFTRANDAFQEILGFTEETLVDADFAAIAHQDDAEQVRKAVAEVAGGGLTSLEVSFRHQDWSYRRLRFTLRGVEEDGAIYGVGRDATDPAQVDETARRSLRLLNKIHLSAKIGGWEIDLVTGDQYWTEETYRIHEVPLDFRPTYSNGIAFYAPEDYATIAEHFTACTRGIPYDLELQIITAKNRRIWVRTAALPGWDGGKVTHVYGSFQDIDEAKRRELELQEKLTIIEHQRSAIHSMSTPIIQVWDGVLALPVVGVLDAARASDMTERLLEAVVRTAASEIILDLTGVEVVDEATAEHLVRIMSAIRLLGAHSVLTGIRPAVAQTFVELGADLSGTATRSNLRDAIRAAMRRSRA